MFNLISSSNQIVTDDKSSDESSHRESVTLVPVSQKMVCPQIWNGDYDLKWPHFLLQLLFSSQIIKIWFKLDFTCHLHWNLYIVNKTMIKHFFFFNKMLELRMNENHKIVKVVWYNTVS